MPSSVPTLSFLPHPQLSSQPQHRTDQPRSRKRRATTSSHVKHETNATPVEQQNPNAPPTNQPTVGDDQEQQQQQAGAPVESETRQPNDTSNTLSQFPAISPNLTFSGLPSAFQTPQPSGPVDGVETNANAPGGDQNAVGTAGQQGYESLFGLPPTPYEGQENTPSASGSAHTDPEKDPFLSLLEQLAENEHSRGGPSELDFFLGNGGNG